MKNLELKDWIMIYSLILIAEVPFEIICMQGRQRHYKIAFIDTAGKIFQVFDLEPWPDE